MIQIMQNQSSIKITRVQKHVQFKNICLVAFVT